MQLRLTFWADLFNLKSWVGRAKDCQPKAMVTYHAVAINTNLQENEGKLTLQNHHSIIFNIQFNCQSPIILLPPTNPKCYIH